MSFGENRFHAGDLIKTRDYYGIVLQLNAGYMLVAQSNGLIVKSDYSDWALVNDVTVRPHFIELANLWGAMENVARDKLMEIFEQASDLNGISESIKAVHDLDRSLQDVLETLGAPRPHYSTLHDFKKEALLDR